VKQAIDKLMLNRTVIVIAHRLSTIRNANQIIVLDKGTAAERGTHEEVA
jgi:ABC-type multidrug transport system fused ATPase/permease subunit